jgi:hypothetical protein
MSGGSSVLGARIAESETLLSWMGFSRRSSRRHYGGICCWQYIRVAIISESVNIAFSGRGLLKGVSSSLGMNAPIGAAEHTG